MMILPIKKQWFDMIAQGVKNEEYRTIKPYYKTRFINACLLRPDGTPSRNYSIIGLRNGYSAKSPMIVVTVILDIGEGKEEWGAQKGETYYILKIVERHVLIADGKLVYKY